eukprot:PhF_6_TR993/c0_g1_i2/m.1948
MARLLPQTIESTSYSSNGAHTQSDTVPNAIPNHDTNTFPYNHHHLPPNTITNTNTYTGTTQYNKPPNRYTYRNTNLNTNRNTNINTSQQYDTPTPHNRPSTNNDTFTIRAVPITTFTRRQYTARGVVGCCGFHLVRDWWCPRMAYGEGTTGLCTTSRR